MQISGKSFVVTGAGNGIGREVVLQLLDKGAYVAAIDLREEALAETATLANAGNRLSLHLCDVSKRVDVQSVFEDVLAARGVVDGLINIAGIIQRFVKFQDLELAEIEKLMAVNFWGTVYTTRVALPLLLDRPEASIVNVSSMGAFTPVPGQTAYGATKAAVKLLTKGLREELADTNVAVTVVYPGAIGSKITEHSGLAAPGNLLDSDAVPPKTTTPKDAAKSIIGAIEHGSSRVVIGDDARALDVFSHLSPQRASKMLTKRMMSLLDPHSAA